MLSAVLQDDTDGSAAGQIRQTDIEHCFEVNSLTTLQEAIKQELGEIIISGDEGLLRAAFNYQTGIKKASILVIRTTRLSMMHNQDIKQLIKSGLLILYIEVDCIEAPNALMDNCNFYSSLQKLSINSKKYTEISFGRGSEEDENYARIRASIDKKCKKITLLNGRTKEFIEKDLANYQTQSDELGKLKTDETGVLSNDQVKKGILIAKYRSFFSKLIKFYQDILCDSTFNLLLDIAREWDIQNIVINNKIDKFQRVLQVLPGFDVNCQYQATGGTFTRLIDLATENDHLEMVVVLHNQRANISRGYVDNRIPGTPRPYANALRDLSNFPFVVALARKESELNNFFLAQEESLYDGIAWLIYINDHSYFDDVFEGRKIDFNKPISHGLFNGFTLFQLMVYYQRTELFFKTIEKISDPLTSFNSIFPNRETFPYSGWSAFAMIIYRGMFDELEWLSKKADIKGANLTNNKNYNAIQLLVEGSSQRRHAVPVFGFEGSAESGKSENHKKSLAILMQFIQFDGENFELFYKESNRNLPLLHFCILAGVFSVIRGHRSLYEADLNRRVNFPVGESEQEIDALQLVAISNSDNDEGTAEYLFDLYNEREILTNIIEPLVGLEGINLFQYCILYRNALFFKLLDWKDCPVNMPFPSSHSWYPGWLPIHVIILMEKIGNLSDYLFALLKRKNVDITIPIPVEGRPHYIAGYYPSSAIFYNRAGSVSPLKNSELHGPILSGKLEYFMPLIKRLSHKTKRNILDQALFFAIVHYNGWIGSAHNNQIQLLVAEGANPYQSFGTNGDLIIDLAREMGLLHLFPSHLENRVRKVMQQIPLISGNVRESELSSFSKISLQVNEDYYSVISLVRNGKSGNAEHVLILVEQIIQGRSLMHFIDFVKDRERIGLGKVRHCSLRGKTTDTLLFSCTLPMMKIGAVEDLKCQSWIIPNEAARKLLDSVEADVSKDIHYALPGNRSLFSWSSSQKGHNCYTWAREKLLSTESLKIQQALTPTLEEWLGTLPSLKDSPWYKNKCLLFSAASLGVAVVGTGLSLYAASFNSEAGSLKFEL